jgi:hypothetical protein
MGGGGGESHVHLSATTAVALTARRHMHCKKAWPTTCNLNRARKAGMHVCSVSAMLSKV